MIDRVRIDLPVYQCGLCNGFGQMRAANPDKAYKTFTDASDMADAIAFLVSDTAARMNGQRLALHG